LNGQETILQLKKEYPGLNVLALTMLDDEMTLIRLIKAGVNGYMNKDVEPAELKAAILSICNKGSYFTDQVTGKLIDLIREPVALQFDPFTQLSQQELKFIELACSEYTYKMIADKMCLSMKTID